MAGSVESEGSGGSPELTVFGDYTCPFSYLAEVHLARLHEEGVRVHHRPFELRPAPTPLADHDDAESQARWETLVAPLATELGVEARRPRVFPRTRKAHEAAAFAAEKGWFPRLHRSLFRAHFVEGRDIGRIDVLSELGRSAGLDPVELRIALDLDTFADLVGALERDATARGVTSSPSFVSHDELLVGLHPFETLLELATGPAEAGRRPETGERWRHTSD